jgi:heat shock protein HslJ
MTQMACFNNDNNNWEDYIATNIQNSYAFKISNETLEIYSKGFYNLIFTLKP